MGGRTLNPMTMELIKRKPQFFDADLWDLPSRMFKDDLFKGRDLPAVNVKDSDKGYEIEVAAPGYKKDELKVDLDGNVMTISSERKDEQKEEKEGYTRKEWHYSSFKRSFQLPDHADLDAMKASHADGVLRILVPKRSNGNAANKRTIAIH